jgi:hypothetical protein
MRSLVAALAALFILASPAAASADSTLVGRATTTTGETLIVSFGYPGNGTVEYGRTTAFMHGAAGLEGGSGEHTRIVRLAVGFGDAYEAPGSTYLLDVPLQPNNGWETDGQIAFEGTRKVYITAIAEDGTRATATSTFTLDPRLRTQLTSYGVLYDWRLPEFSPPALRADLVRLGDFGGEFPVAGAQVIFYVDTERVCDAITDASGRATCPYSSAATKAATSRDGYTAVFRETDTLHRATGWGAAVQTESKHVP